MCPWFSSFLLKELVSRVKRRIPIRIDKFWRSTNEVEMCLGSGSPFKMPVRQPMQAAGLKLLLESCALHTVLDCPQGTFQGSGVKTTFGCATGGARH